MIRVKLFLSELVSLSVILSVGGLCISILGLGPVSWGATFNQDDLTSVLKNEKELESRQLVKRKRQQLAKTSGPRLLAKRELVLQVLKQKSIEICEENFIENLPLPPQEALEILRYFSDIDDVSFRLIQNYLTDILGPRLSHTHVSSHELNLLSTYDNKISKFWSPSILKECHVKSRFTIPVLMEKFFKEHFQNVESKIIGPGQFLRYSLAKSYISKPMFDYFSLSAHWSGLFWLNRARSGMAIGSNSKSGASSKLLAGNGFNLKSYLSKRKTILFGSQVPKAPDVIQGVPIQFVADKRKRSKGLSRRENLYRRYSGLQMINMANSFSRFQKWMSANRGEIILSDEDGEIIRVRMSQSEIFCTSVRLFRRSLVELGNNSIAGFRGTPPWEDVILAAYELDVIGGNEFQEVLDLEELWNPKETLFNKVLKFVEPAGGIAMIFVNPGVGTSIGILLALTRTLSRNGDQSNDSNDIHNIVECR